MPSLYTHDISSELIQLQTELPEDEMKIKIWIWLWPKHNYLSDLKLSMATISLPF